MTELYELFARCNETEAYQIARRAGLNVFPDLPKENLIRCILGEEEPPPRAPHDIDLWRLTIMQFVLDHRRKLEAQLKCPAKTMDPRACFGCVDAQVLSCLVHNNANNHELVQIRKKIVTT